MTETQTLTVVARYTGSGSPRYSVDGGSWLTPAGAHSLLTGWFDAETVMSMLLDLWDQAEDSQDAGAETGFANMTVEVR